MILDHLKNYGRRGLEWLPSGFRGSIVPLYHGVTHLCAKVSATVQRNGVGAFWYSGCTNFGDLLTPALLKSYGYTPILETDPQDRGKIGHAELIGVGSILGMTDSGYDGIILGSGMLSEEDAKSFPNADILGLRGELTKKLIRCEKDVVLGDPGLLAHRLTPQKTGKRHLLGIVVHHAEFDRNVHLKFFPEIGRDVVFIDPRRQPSLVLRDIARCEHIASSSLHGLVVADALGIPNTWMLLSEKFVLGHGYKFHDYYSAFGVKKDGLQVHVGDGTGVLLEKAAPPSELVAEKQLQLHQLFENLKGILRENREKRRLQS